MKNSVCFIFAFSILCSCGSGEKKENVQANVQASVNDTMRKELNPEQIEKIKKIHKAFAEVYPISYKETVINFKLDPDPDSEIDVWLNMVNAYEGYLNAREDKPDQNTKKEIFRLILSRSMLAESEAIKNSELKILTEAEAHKVLSFYTAEPEPIDVTEK